MGDLMPFKLSVLLCLYARAFAVIFSPSAGRAAAATTGIREEEEEGEGRGRKGELNAYPSALAEVLGALPQPAGDSGLGPPLLAEESELGSPRPAEGEYVMPRPTTREEEMPPPKGGLHWRSIYKQVILELNGFSGMECCILSTEPILAVPPLLASEKTAKVVEARGFLVSMTCANLYSVEAMLTWRSDSDS
ncbi:hypothetical protein AXF42_Ash020077 [Apostasia shenzhenica]|uniref:Uncharacterized protein n=1 Tax=Apostasia shenzhenica TaxID=1088818 RepID=A0A2I0APP9_9ASPA|nr:hypothetical protein AXF42_Ash020077 [Apostasia shenzhenica]